ncbi:MAG: hybrid sensor histidine kinase/response regulator [Desulfamplus sp.]|nr:hybrid sensor histidine kinase/response regulator [Desulfamplus sp.]
MPEKQIILIIDDSPSNIKIMNEILKEDYIITVATNGEKAISSLKINNFFQTDLFDEKRPLPDIILLDIVMPGMDGYEVCRQIKNNKSTSDIPIIFITSKDDIEDEEKGFQMGAVDYITKPVSPSIVKARIKTHLLLKKQRDLLQNSISVLQHRTELLLHKAELGMLAAGLAHDINNILFVAMMIENLPDAISDNFEEKSIIKAYVKDTMESLRMGRDVCRGFTNYLKDFDEEEMIQLFPPLFKPLDMFEKTFKVKLYREIPANLPYIKCKGSQIKRVIINLFINACQAVDGQQIKRIAIRAWSEKGQIFFAIQDNGPGIPDHILPHIFEEHYTTRKDGNGLGLSMVRKILHNHNGTIECSTTAGEGTTFTLSLPVFEV